MSQTPGRLDQSARPQSLTAFLQVSTPLLHCSKELRGTLAVQVDLHCAWLEELLLGREEGSPRPFDEVSLSSELRQCQPPFQPAHHELHVGKAMSALFASWCR